MRKSPSSRTCPSKPWPSADSRSPPAGRVLLRDRAQARPDRRSAHAGRYATATSATCPSIGISATPPTTPATARHVLPAFPVRARRRATFLRKHEKPCWRSDERTRREGRAERSRHGLDLSRLVVVGFTAMNFVMKLGSLKGHSSPALTASLFSPRRSSAWPCSLSPASPSKTRAGRAAGRRGGSAGRRLLLLPERPQDRPLRPDHLHLHDGLPHPGRVLHAVWDRPLNAAAGPASPHRWPASP